uniref:Histone deacetylase complex subunit SAP30 Sin3 binding domain-containing protein n=1 Tax=Tetraselmis sp. GSL018 TaxID=582737 RepID=A0A061R1L6_9CHLO|eukprot:CAMPEP_0177599038 /NCGR_PEP_ID=MMETSP0419_2-20121207/12745_1 /TAXON_ID=582737 /ORGANISM="Tetraselmis sp., Strain GSL018" /LENGTH=135 /DNA_ID=CAMNT_0019091675 /DNA_START=222 /DNA_END=629 /DNA_ORIENTATION=+
MERKRSVRVPVGRTAANGSTQQSTSDDDDVEATAAPSPPLPRSSGRRAVRVDFSKLETSSLRKYQKVHHLNEVPQNSTKEELIPVVTRHFAAQVVEEDEVLLNFALALKKHSMSTRNPAPQPSRKQRHAAKQKTR